MIDNTVDQSDTRFIQFGEVHILVWYRKWITDAHHLKALFDFLHVDETAVLVDGEQLHENGSFILVAADTYLLELIK